MFQTVLIVLPVVAVFLLSINQAVKIQQHRLY